MCHHCEHPEGQTCDCEEHGECGCGCGECCEKGGHFHRRYQTKAEQITVLESYLGELKLEVQAVEERLTDLRK
jgi:hypothetical protein